MKDERIKEIMAQTPYPDSMSVYLAMKQIANEVEQDVRSELTKLWSNTYPAVQPFPIITCGFSKE